MFHLLTISTSKDIFKNEKCKVTFGLEYILVPDYSFLVFKSDPDFTIQSLVPVLESVKMMHLDSQPRWHVCPVR